MRGGSLFWKSLNHLLTRTNERERLRLSGFWGENVRLFFLKAFLQRVDREKGSELLWAQERGFCRGGGFFGSLRCGLFLQNLRTDSMRECLPPREKKRGLSLSQILPLEREFPFLKRRNYSVGKKDPGESVLFKSSKRRKVFAKKRTVQEERG